MVGVDYAFSKFDLNVGFTGHVVSHSEEEIVGDKVDTFFFLRGETDFEVLDRSVLVNAFFINEFGDWDYRFSPQLTYTIRDDLDIALGLDIFAGDHNTLYGQFDSKDRVWLAITYSF